MAFHNRVRLPVAGICAVLLAGPAAADNTQAALTAEQARGGWLQLFDGESLFGWAVEGEVTVKAGVLTFAKGKPSKAVFRGNAGEYRDFEIVLQSRGYLKIAVGRTEATKGATGGGLPPYTPTTYSREKPGAIPTTTSGIAGSTYHDTEPRAELKTGAVVLEADGTEEVRVYAVKFRPFVETPLFDGKTLAGWKPFAGDPKREKSVFSVTPAGELSLKNGPGDLQTEKQFDDFVLQLDCKTNGPALNSGVFFRCLPGQYQQGYEAQIQNSFLSNDRTKPVDYGTGAVYRRVKARKVVSNDDEWFAMTVLARGPHITTWVNGYPVVSWTDDRKPAENARQGLYTKKGAISLQGHDPTTDLLFRNIRIAELK